MRMILPQRQQEREGNWSRRIIDTKLRVEHETNYLSLLMDLMEEKCYSRSSTSNFTGWEKKLNC